MIPAEAVDAAVNAWRNTPIGGDALMNALEAAVPHMMAITHKQGDGMSDRDELRGTLINTICNASFYPKRAQPYLLGGDMSEVLDRTADGLLAAGYRKVQS